MPIIIWPCGSTAAECSAGLGEGACSVHVCFDGDRFVWASHGPVTVSDEARLPITEGIEATKGDDTITWQPATREEAAVFGWTEDEHRVTAALGAVLELRPVADVAKVSGFAAQALVTEAKGWTAG